MTISSLITAFLCSPQALQKICLANHICSLVELLHADAIQQLEVALLGSPAANMLDVLLMATTSQPSCMPLPSKPFCSAATLAMTLVAPPQVPIAGVTQVEGLPSTEVAISESRPSPATSSDTKYYKIMPTPIPATSSSIPNLLSIIVPKLVVLTYALPEQINCPGGCKDCMLTHIWEHLEISVGCPMYGKGFQNVPSLLKHGVLEHNLGLCD